MNAPRPDPIVELRHDLRTPLNQIIGYSEMLQEEAQESDQKSLNDDLQRILFASRNLLGMINKVIDSDHIKIIGELPNLKEISKEALPHPSLFSAEDLKVILPKIAEQEEVLSNTVEIPARILIVDDDPPNRDMLARRLSQEGFSAVQAGGGHEALALLRTDPTIDVVLLDVLMPEMDGHDVLLQIKSDEALRHIPVIMISALDELESVLRCIQNGADDYLGKPFNPTFLRARLGSSLDRKRLRDQEQRTYLELKKTQEQLVGELAEAAAYVRTQLPEKISGKIVTDWEFNSSSSLGGDAFGYQWLDDHRFSLYLLDVCGHGVGAALLSISALRAIRNQSLPEIDFSCPAQVLAGLNAAFQMERHNNMYFTLWYGVYDARTRELTFASGGHPPACLVAPEIGSKPVLLRTPNLFIGGMIEAEFSQESIIIEPSSRLYVLSDGVYEIRRKSGPMMTLTEVFEFLATQPQDSKTILADLWTWICKEHGDSALEDDFSIMEFRF